MTTTTESTTTDLLNEKCIKILGMLRKADMRVAMSRYDIGVEVQQAKDDENKYGKSAVARIAEFVKCTSANLYEYARVTKVWTRDEFDALTKKKSASGAYLTFSHLAAISTVDDGSRRTELANECVEKELSVRDLKALMSESDKDTSSKRVRVLKPSEAAQRAATAMGAGEAGLRTVLESVEVLKCASLEELTSAHAAYEKLRELFERVGAELSAMKAERERSEAVAPPVSGERGADGNAEFMAAAV